jgi:putative Mg2+ transporter-C (MgtC) family protein
MIPYVETVLQILATFIFTFIYGYERQKAHKPIGFVTYIFVAIGGCVLGISAISLAPTNPLPLLAAVITGIGFLGAGALVKSNDRVFGFSSAASIWIFAIFGLTIGVQEYFLATWLYAYVILATAFDKYLEIQGIGSYQKKLTITTNKIVSEKEIEAAIVIGSVNVKTLSIDLNKKDNFMTIVYHLEGKKQDINHIPQRLYEKSWFASFKVE